MTRRNTVQPVRQPRVSRRAAAAAPTCSAQNGVLAAVLAILIAVLVGACGTTLPPAGSVAPSAVPGSGAPGSTPQPSAWPGNAVLGIVGLGAGDTEIAKAVADFSEAVAAEDLVRMRGAAGGLQNLVSGLSRDVDRISIYPPMAGLVTQYRAALPPMLDGARKLQDAIDAGDAAAIVSATKRITEGMQLYGQIREPLSAWVEQATSQQRLLLK